MSVKQDLIIFAVSAVVFIACSILMVIAHETLSRYDVVVYGFISVYGVSAVVAPVFMVRTMDKVIRSAFRRR